MSKKLVSETIQELSLYPYRSTPENILRSCVWLAAWWFGVRGQETVSEHALGGAYFIFALSLLLEFFPEKRTLPLTRFIHGCFCLFLLITAIYAFILVTEFSPAQGTKPIQDYKEVVDKLCFNGVVIRRMIALNLLRFLELHRLFYDKEAEQKREQEQNRQIAYDQFTANLNGPQEGRDVQ